MEGCDGDSTKLSVFQQNNVVGYVFSLLNISQTKELISAGKTPHEYNNKGLSRDTVTLTWHTSNSRDYQPCSADFIRRSSCRPADNFTKLHIISPSSSELRTQFMMFVCVMT